jgi:hypothetical protein
LTAAKRKRKIINGFGIRKIPLQFRYVDFHKKLVKK